MTTLGFIFDVEPKDHPIVVPHDVLVLLLLSKFCPNNPAAYACYSKILGSGEIGCAD